MIVQLQWMARTVWFRRGTRGYRFATQAGGECHLRRVLPAAGWRQKSFHRRKCLIRNGGDDETRTRDLCRDSPASKGNWL